MVWLPVFRNLFYFNFILHTVHRCWCMQGHMGAAQIPSENLHWKLVLEGKSLAAPWPQASVSIVPDFSQFQSDTLPTELSPSPFSNILNSTSICLVWFQTYYQWYRKHSTGLTNIQSASSDLGDGHTDKQMDGWTDRLIFQSVYSPPPPQLC